MTYRYACELAAGRVTNSVDLLMPHSNSWYDPWNGWSQPGHCEDTTCGKITVPAFVFIGDKDNHYGKEAKDGDGNTGFDDYFSSWVEFSTMYRNGNTGEPRAVVAMDYIEIGREWTWPWQDTFPARKGKEHAVCCYEYAGSDRNRLCVVTDGGHWTTYGTGIFQAWAWLHDPVVDPASVDSGLNNSGFGVWSSPPRTVGSCPAPPDDLNCTDWASSGASSGAVSPCVAASPGSAGTSTSRRRRRRRVPGWWS